MKWLKFLGRRGSVTFRGIYCFSSFRNNKGLHEIDTHGGAMPMAWRLAKPTMLALPMSPGFSASWAWMRACSSAAFLAFSMASFMKVAAWEGWIVLPIGSRSGWEEEGVFGCEIEKKISDRLGRQAGVSVRAHAWTRAHTHTHPVVDCGRLWGATHSHLLDSHLSG